MSAGYVDEINKEIIIHETKVNTVLFGVINGTVGLLNSSIITVIKGFQSSIVETFQSVPVIQKSIQHFGDCVIGINVEDIESFISDLQFRLKFDFPKVDQDILAIDDQGITNGIAEVLESVGDEEVEEEKNGGIKSWFKKRVKKLIANVRNCL